MNKLLTAKFWKKFFKYSFLGFCALMIILGLNQSALRAVLAEDEDTYVYYPTLEEPADYQSPGPEPYDPYDEDTYVYYPTLDTPEPAAPYQPPVYTPPTYTQPAPTYTQPAPRGGDFSFRYPECDWATNQVVDIYQDSLGNYDRRNYHTQPGACGAPDVTQYTQPEPNPCTEDVIYFDPNAGRNIHKYGGYLSGNSCVYAFDPVSTPVQIPSCSEDVTYWDPNAGSNIRKHGGYFESYHPLADSQGCVYAFDRIGQPVVAQAPSQYQSQSLTAPITVTQQAYPGFVPPFPFNLPPPPFFPAPQPFIPVIPAPVIPQPVISQPVVPITPQQPVIVQQPAGTPITNTNTNTNNNNTNTATATVPAPQVITAQVPTTEVRFATVDQPRVVEVAGNIVTKELPKTGLPLLAFGTAAFIPVGLRLRRFRKASIDESANFIWEQRQFKI